MTQVADVAKTKKAMIAGGVSIVCVAVLAWFIGGVFFSPTHVVEKHLSAIQSGEYQKAYTYFSQGARKDTAFTDFRSNLSRTPVLLYLSEYELVQGRRDGKMIVYGVFKGKPGTTGVEGEYTMVRQGFGWKIQQYAIGQYVREEVQMSFRLDDLGINLTPENRITNKRSFPLAEREPVSVVGVLQHMPKGAILTAVLINMETTEAVATRRTTMQEDIVDGAFSFTFDEARSLPVGTHAVLVNLFPSEETMQAVDQQVIRFRVTE